MSARFNGVPVLPVLLAAGLCWSGATTPGAQARVPVGQWGGQHIGLTVTDRGASLEYDCAHGTIDGPMTLDAKGRFNAAGGHVTEHPGPARENEPEKVEPARYTGETNGKTMTLTVKLVNGDQTVGTFSLELGKPARIRKCQ